MGRPSMGRNQMSAAVPLAKYIFVHWVGPDVSVIRRGLWNAQLQWAVTQIGSCCAIAFRREALALNDLVLGELIEELKRKTGGAMAARITCEGHLARLEEEMQASRRRT